MGEVVSFERRKKRRIAPPPMPVAEFGALLILKNRDFNASCREIAEIAEKIRTALEEYEDSVIISCGFATEEGEA